MDLACSGLASSEDLARCPGREEQQAMSHLPWSPPPAPLNILNKH